MTLFCDVTKTGYSPGCVRPFAAVPLFPMKFLRSVLLMLVLLSGDARAASNPPAAAAPLETGGLAGLPPIPPQPGEESWRFIDDLRSPLWTRHPWGSERVGADEADLSRGVRVQPGIADPLGRLVTAYKDLERFLGAGGVPNAADGYVIETTLVADLKGEAFRIDVGPARCVVSAGEVEGIRRGLFFLEDEMLRRRGAFLALGKSSRTPSVTRRISRCFFGPIKRLPKMRDELMDDVDYYPPEYLNRLAHEGVNGLWLTVEFRDLGSTSFTPQAGQNAARRLAKLRRTVDACLRYGIRTYIFCIEPRAWEPDSSVVTEFPDLGGVRLADGKRTFCPSSEIAARYLRNSVSAIFRAVPDLGGMINISYGERPTTCLSAMGAADRTPLACPRCGPRQPWEVLHASLTAMEQGMHAVAPDAELISWMYIPRGGPVAEWVYDVAAHTPKGVVLQFNFESGVRRTEFGREFVGGDYWISTPGPSGKFERVAAIARDTGTPVSAKIQASASHEVATVPFVPVPALLYRKFAAMRRLGISHTMLCWYFGNYPGPMNKAAGELAMDPLPDEEQFLQRLAALYWRAPDRAAIVAAWKHFGQGYEHYPLSNIFQYFGPMHNGPVWPLLLKPQDAPVSPTWQLGSNLTGKPWPPSGDRIGESLGGVFELHEAVELTRRMSTEWEKGVALLRSVEDRYRDEPDRLRDIGVARALGIQFRSGHNILRFYLQRENMFRLAGPARLSLLAELREILAEELRLDEQLLALCAADSRLGFHSEAEGYMYFPEKIRWRMAQLRDVLANDVPELDRIIRSGAALFPGYTGAQAQGPVAEAVSADGALWTNAGGPLPALRWQPLQHGLEASQIRWGAAHDPDALYVAVADAGDGKLFATGTVTRVTIKIEPRRLWPARHFVFDLASTRGGGELRISRDRNGWIMRIPKNLIGLAQKDTHPIRVDVRVQKAGGSVSAWQPDRPLAYRPNLGTDNPADNPADLGWLVLATP